MKTSDPITSKARKNIKAGNALFEQIAKAAEMAEALQTPAGKDAAKALAEVMREFSLARMGGFNEEK